MKAGSKPLIGMRAGPKPLIGKRVVFLCSRYTYSGVIMDISDGSILLSRVKVIEKTGPIASKHWKEVDSFPTDIKVNLQLDAVETYWESDK